MPAIASVSPPSKPLVSVITPTYNCAAYLARTWWCLQNQTYTNWEWILVDDGSTDTTSQLIAGFNDPRIRYHKLPQNVGRGGARAAALAVCTGDYLAVWDADDIYPLTRLETAVTALQAEGTDYWCSHSLLLDNYLQPTGVRTWPSLPECPRLFVFHTLVVRREVLQGIGFDTRWRAAEDYRPLLSVILHYRGSWHEAPLACYVENREANLRKAITTNRNQFAQFREMLAAGEFPAKVQGHPFNPIRIVRRYRLKLAVLNLMRLCPPLYALTLRRREAIRQPQLSPDIINFLKQVRALGI